MTRTAEPDISEVFASAAAGDEVSFARIVTACDDEMYWVCVAVCRDQFIAADAVQSAWTIAWKKLSSVRQPERLRSWLVSVAINEGRKLLKERTRRSEIEHLGGASQKPAAADPATGIDMIDLIAALERVEPDDRAQLAMRYMAGFFHHYRSSRSLDTCGSEFEPDGLYVITPEAITAAEYRP